MHGVVDGIESRFCYKEGQKYQLISPEAVNFLILLRQLSVNVSFDLVKLQLDAESFAFFMLQSALKQTDA